MTKGAGMLAPTSARPRLRAHVCAPPSADYRPSMQSAAQPWCDPFAICLPRRSADRSRCHGRTCRAPQLERLDDERELVDPRLGEVLEHEILKEMDAVDCQRDIVDRQIDCLVGIGRDFDRPVIRTKQHRVLLDQPLGRSHADARAAARVELVVDAPVPARSRIDGYGVTGLLPYVLLVHRLFQFVYGALVANA